MLDLYSTNVQDISQQQQWQTSSHVYYIAASFLISALIYLYKRRNFIYLVDFACYRPPDYLRVPIASYSELVYHGKQFDDESIQFQIKSLPRSGLGDDTCLPHEMHRLPYDVYMSSSAQEVETTLTAVTSQLLEKTGRNPKSIDIIVSNCSIFNPTPSITAMIINKFGMKSNIMSFNLSGMGCSAGVLSISLVKDLLRVHKNSVALVLSMEAITPNGYIGNKKSMLLTNCLFRMGGTAILLSSRPQDKRKSKYVLQNLVRVHTGADDKSYQCVFQEPDSEGHVGISLSKDILNIAGDALRANITKLGPMVLPYSEQILYLLSLIRRRLLRTRSPVYVPDFTKAVKHFCIHAGGRAVVDAVSKNLGLSPEQAEASKMTLYRFGNTSSSSIWYELSYIEAIGRMKKGERVWQIAFGSGFKCNSAVWRCIANIENDDHNAWADRIHRYPVPIN